MCIDILVISYLLMESRSIFEVFNDLVGVTQGCLLGHGLSYGNMAVLHAVLVMAFQYIGILLFCSCKCGSLVTKVDEYYMPHAQRVCIEQNYAQLTGHGFFKHNSVEGVNSVNCA
jgi:hypothetical protein